MKLSISVNIDLETKAKFNKEEKRAFAKELTDNVQASLELLMSDLPMKEQRLLKGWNTDIYTETRFYKNAKH